MRRTAILAKEFFQYYGGVNSLVGMNEKNEDFPTSYNTAPVIQGGRHDFIIFHRSPHKIIRVYFLFALC